MIHLKPFTSTNCSELTNKRPKETKFGERVHVLSNHPTSIYEQLLKLDVTYVIFGIQEDIGVFANLGKIGTSKAWQSTIKILLNTQNNDYNTASRTLILGHLEFNDYQEQLKTMDPSSKSDLKLARKWVETIDIHVNHLVSTIVSAGKIPIVIGGGHNNAYGNIKGTALALKKQLSVINFDAHHDFRAEEGRHSGNGFSYAYNEGFIKKYFAFGLHENYTSEAIFKKLNAKVGVAYNTFEIIAIRKELLLNDEMETALEHLGEGPLGIEIDCDAIAKTSSSAMTPSGFSTLHARRFVHFFGSQKNTKYLHICEASPTAENEGQVGKLISYLITDFIRAHSRDHISSEETF